ncbi:MAG: tail fiber protein [Chitinophagaceae bacterium]|nr:tail fiber protein [Chitinophagaceae bacterium]
MKKLFLFASILAGLSTHAQLGVGTILPHASAQLEITATDKGVLLPRMDATQRLAIPDPVEGLLVYQTSSPEGFYYYDGTEWTTIAQEQEIIAPGTVVAYAGNTAPEGWMLCSGAAISRSTFPELFATIGTSFGAGNGTSTFNIPDLRGRAVFGLDDMGGVAANRLTTTFGISGTQMGAKGGSAKTEMSINGMPSHAHDFTGQSVTTSTNSHSHIYNDAYYAENFSGGTGNNSRIGNVNNTDYDNNFYWRTNSNTHSTGPSSINSGSTSHTHTFTATGNISNTGSGTTFDVLNPGIALNYIIKL